MGFFLDCTTIIMVFDTILQDHSHYPDWGHMRVFGKEIDIRQIWMKGWGGNLRMIVTWGCLASAATGAIKAIWENAADWIRDDNRLSANEWQRAMVVAVVFCMDICVVIQDWEFPSFENH